MIRAQSNEVIKCESPEFKALICLPQDDLMRLYKQCLDAGATW